MKFCLVFGHEPWFLPPALEMAATLRARGHQVECVYAQLHGTPPAEGDLNIPVLASVPRPNGWRRAFTYHYLGRVLKAVLSRRSYDVLLACDPVALQAVHAFSLQRRALTGYWNFEIMHRPWDRRFSMDMVRALRFHDWLKKLDFFLAPSPSRADRLLKDTGGNLPYAVILNCRAKRTVEPLSNQDVQKQLDALQGFRIKLVHAGRVSPTQCITEIVGALAHLPSDTALVLAGIADPHYLAELRRLAEVQGTGSRVLYLGRLSRNDTYAVLEQADIGFALYDQQGVGGAVDPAPNKIGDYAAAGIPMVGGEQEFVAHWLRDRGMGICLGGVTPETIANAVTRLASEGLEARKNTVREVFASEFNMDAQADKLLHLVAHVTASTSHPR